jgi:hypothetical protein
MGRRNGACGMSAQHRAPRQPLITTGRILRWAVLPVLAGLLVLAYWHGSQVQAQHSVPRWTDGVAVCMAEDGSTPGQAFPCRWDAAYQGNGAGVNFTLQAAAQ